MIPVHMHYAFPCRLKKMLKLFAKLIANHLCTHQSLCISIVLIEYRIYTNEILFAHTVAVMRLHLSKKNNPLLIVTF